MFLTRLRTLAGTKRLHVRGNLGLRTQAECAQQASWSASKSKTHVLVAAEQHFPPQ